MMSNLKYPDESHVGLELLLEMFTSELEILFDLAFIQTEVVMTFQNTISRGKEPACQCRRCKRLKFYPWVGKILLEDEMAAHFSIPAWRIPWTEEPDGLQSIGRITESDTTEAT